MCKDDGASKLLDSSQWRTVLGEVELRFALAVIALQVNARAFSGSANWPKATLLTKNP